jgi:hypothetical protein
MAIVGCPSDTLLGDKTAAVIPYGSSWKRGAFVCKSSVNGFHCTNADGHGFTIAMGEARRF